VTVGARADLVRGPVLVMAREGVRELLYGGFRVRLHRDECESYYHNLRSPRPHCYVLTRPGAEGEPVPFLVSACFDEANAYLEGEDVQAYAVDMPPEIYRWVEAYVLEHYVPRPRRKRERDDWKGARK
jgi:hypothetical protein